jgi:hypothetical protein
VTKIPFYEEYPMATEPKDLARQEMEDEYIVWADICRDKHGLPWPIPQTALADASDVHLAREIKKLKVLGRTPHEG